MRYSWFAAYLLPTILFGDLSYPDGLPPMTRFDKRYATMFCVKGLIERNQYQCFVETGTTRSLDEIWRSGDGGGTLLLGSWAKNVGAHLYSVDISPDVVAIAQSLTESLRDHVTIVCDDSLHFLEQFSEQIDVLYLDGFDYEESNYLPSQKHCLAEAKLALPKMNPKGVIIIDDYGLPYEGKGGLAKPYLIEQGWIPRVIGYQILFMKKA